MKYKSKRVQSRHIPSALNLLNTYVCKLIFRTV